MQIWKMRDKVPFLISYHICVGVPKIIGLVLVTLVSMKFSGGVCCGTASGSSVQLGK